MNTLSAVRYEATDFLYRYTNTVDFSGDVPTHTHNGWEFLYVKDGEMTYAVNGSVYEIHPGYLIISRPGAVHTLRAKGAIHYERYTFVVAESLLDQDIIAQIPQDLHILDTTDNQMLLSIFEKAGFYLANLQAEQRDKMLRNLIHELWVNISLAAKAPSAAIVAHAHPVILRAVIFIDDHIREPLTVQAVSDALFITPSHLHHCFTRHMNITPRQYIMLRKLQQVQRALINAANPTEVCRYYGFATYSTFYRNYQKIFGCRPSDSTQQTLRKIEF